MRGHAEGQVLRRLLVGDDEREISHDLDRLGSGSRYTFASLVVLARESLMCVGGVRDAEKGRARGVRRVW